MSAGQTSGVRSFYATLGLELPEWAQRDAAVRCFADPDAHAHADRDSSCSVNLESGAWMCHGCGARGGAYDAALARGHTPRSAIDLMVDHGLAAHRLPSPDALQPRALAAPMTTPPLARSSLPLSVTEAEVGSWQRALSADASRWRRERLSRDRGWAPAVMSELGLGFDGERITIPIRNGAGQLRGLLRYRERRAGPKMLAAPGSRLGLIPHPHRERAGHIVLVEGPPDMLAARSRNWPAIAIPGAHAWRPQWAPLLVGRTVTVVMDCDAAGRDAAQRVSSDLQRVATVRVIDLHPGREDGYDLTDWLLAEHPQRRGERCKASSSPKPTITR